MHMCTRVCVCVYTHEHAYSCTYFMNKTFLNIYTRNLVIVTFKKRLGENENLYLVFPYSNTFC